jgi:glycosyltransferase involved in cell wall biosynthesis
MARRVRQLSRLSTIDEIRSLRSVPKTHDVTFVVRLYRQAHHAPINEFRREVARRLHEHPNIDAVVGFIGHTIAGPRRFDAAQTSPREHLARLAGSRLGLYVWGTHQCLSFKLCEFLALGLPIVGQSIPQDRANLAGLPGYADQFGYDDPTDLVDAVAAAVDNPDGLIKLGESNATVFDSHLAPPICAQRILDVVYRS